MSIRPRAYRLDDSGENADRSVGVVIEDDPFDAIDNASVGAGVSGSPRGGRWTTVFLVAVAVLVLLGLGQSGYRLIVELTGDSYWLGGIAIAAASVAVIAAVILLAREFFGVMRERRIERMRSKAIDALGIGSEKEAAALADQLSNLYRDKGNAEVHARIASLSNEIMAAEDRLIFAERELLRPLDIEAKRIVATNAKQVSVVTALSPRAAIDVIFVVYAAVRMLRQLSRLYGGRPGVWSFFRLLKAAFAHLAVTGGIAVGDSLLQQIFGLGVAAKISARLGEGVLNGLMTARFGLAAILVCRPLPFIGQIPPRLGEVAGELLKKGEKEE